MGPPRGRGLAPALRGMNRRAPRDREALDDETARRWIAGLKRDMAGLKRR